MSKYIEVTNNNGIITVDDTTARLVKTRTIPFYCEAPVVIPYQDTYWVRNYIPDQYVLYGYATQHINLESNECLVALRATAKRENVAALGGFVSPTTYMITLMANMTDSDTHMSDFLIDVYGTVPQTEVANTGLEVFDANGVKIFDSNYYYMDVDGTFSILNTGINRFTEELNTYNIGGYGRENYAIAMGSCINKLAIGYMNGQYVPYFSVQYGVVFGDTIYLEKRVSQYYQFVYNGGTWTPQSYSVNSSGIILNTANIS